MAGIVTTGTPLTVDHNDATPNQNTLIGFLDSGSAVWSIGNSGTNNNFVVYNNNSFVVGEWLFLN